LSLSHLAWLTGSARSERQKPGRCSPAQRPSWKLSGLRGSTPLGLEPRTCGSRVPGQTYRTVPPRPLSRESSGRRCRIVQLVPARPGKFGTELGWVSAWWISRSKCG